MHRTPKMRELTSNGEVTLIIHLLKIHNNNALREESLVRQPRKLALLPLICLKSGINWMWLSVKVQRIWRIQKAHFESLKNSSCINTYLTWADWSKLKFMVIFKTIWNELMGFGRDGNVKWAKQVRYLLHWNVTMCFVRSDRP